MSDSLSIDQNSGSAAAGGVAVSPAAPVSDPGSALVLVPPAPVAAVAAPQAEQAVKLDPATQDKLDGMAKGYLDAIQGLDVNDPKFDARMSDIRKLGDDDIQASAQVSSRLLDRPVAAMKTGGISGTSAVSTGLLPLRHQIDDLDPSHQGDLLSVHKILGILPFGDRLRDYFGKYQSSQSHINAIITSLYHGQDTLQQDNADLEQEKANLWAVMERLRQYIYLAQKLDSGLTARIAQVQTADPAKAKVLQEDMLFYVRQKTQDLATQLAVSVQGYLALDVIRRNNLELIRGVDRATTTTISALRTAVIVTQALGDQKLVLDQITALNTTTSNLIESTSAMLRTQSAATNQGAAASTIDVAKLQAAFDNVYATLDEIDAYKLKALDTMAQTSDTLKTQIDKAQPFVDRALAGGSAASRSGSPRR